jgi:hypothetical protein
MPSRRKRIAVTSKESVMKPRMHGGTLRRVYVSHILQFGAEDQIDCLSALRQYKRGYPERTFSPLRTIFADRPIIFVRSRSLVAIGALTSTVTLLTQLGRFRQAADREKEIGQIFLQELRELGKACEAFERAGEWYAQEDANACVFLYSSHADFCEYCIDFCERTANGCFKDAADLHAELDEFPAAIARYEQVANHSLTSTLTRYSVKEYWLRAGLCALAMNVSQSQPPSVAEPNVNPAILGQCDGKAQFTEIWNPGCHVPHNTRGQVPHNLDRCCRSWRRRGFHWSGGRIRSSH